MSEKRSSGDSFPVYAAIEAGGTKFVCAVADANKAIVSTRTVPTETPDVTLAKVREFFQSHFPSGEGCRALGIATFGPAVIDRADPAFGSIAATPKPGWSGTSFLQALDGLAPAVAFDTDVNGAALGEAMHGAGRGCDTIAYVTVGTGIGAGVVHQGRPLNGTSHYEMGHIAVRAHPADDFAGACPFHGDCLEGMAAGPAILKRWGAPLSELVDDHPGHDIIAGYLAGLCWTILLTHAPQRVILGGGVMKTPGLLSRIRSALVARNNDYLTMDAETCLTLPGLGDAAGITGAVEMAANLADKSA